jgi:hypothetical protein
VYSGKQNNGNSPSQKAKKLKGDPANACIQDKATVPGGESIPTVLKRQGENSINNSKVAIAMRVDV